MHALTLTSSHIRQMIEHAAGQFPLEACGLLAGSHAKVEKIIEVKNQAQSPVRFVMDPLEQLAAFEWIDSNHMELLGIFHSHPTGPETVSATDIADSSYAVVNIVLSPAQNRWQVKGFWIENGNFVQVPLLMID